LVLRRVELQEMTAEQKSQAINPEVRGEVGNQSAQIEAQQSPQALEQMRALTQNLMERICERENLNQAMKRVRSNKGSPGVDGMNVYTLEGWMDQNGEQLLRSLLEGQYCPQPVRAVEIPKPGGGVRELGIPTVIDRMIQQAILQVLNPILDPTFSDSSYGFRPKRSAHQALHAASAHVKAGYVYVVDLDLEKFFDRVNHDILMSRLVKRLGDKRLLRLVRRYLQAGMFKNGIVIDHEDGTPQGGPLSPLLANVLLDEFDKELEKRGHRFCRYADDCNIYVRSEQAGQRVMASLTRFLSKRLRLKVNEEKSAVAYAEARQFLGYRLLRGGKLGLAPKSVVRFKDRVREITSRNRGVKLTQVVVELNRYMTGWLNYFRHAMLRTLLRILDAWIQRRLRSYRLIQCKRRYTIVRLLVSHGASPSDAWDALWSRPGKWRLSQKPAVRYALAGAWFKSLGLMNLLRTYDAFKV
jgi:RNA-directed DNA polymerase